MTSPKMNRKISYAQSNLALLLLALTIIIVDRVVKFYVTERIAIGESIEVIPGIFWITHWENEGAAFGLLPGLQQVFIVASLAVFILIILYYSRIIRTRYLLFASAFILGGTVGNLMDRVFFTRVFDYMHIAYWPAFNLSDVALTVGVLILIVHFIRGGKMDDDRIEYAHY